MTQLPAINSLPPPEVTNGPTNVTRRPVESKVKEAEMTVSHLDVSPQVKLAGRRFGYGVAVIVNLVMLVAVQFILDWGWLPFLTDEFSTLVPWISLSLLVSIIANLVYQFNDTPVVKSTGQILSNLISLFVSYQIFLVFPFDFSAYDFNWTVVARVVLILAMVGSGVGMLTEAAKLASGEPEVRRLGDQSHE